MKKKILVVDDTKMSRELLAEIFEEDFEIIPAGNGRQAMEIISIQLNTLAVVLLDLMMPEVDGFAVLDYIKEKGWQDKLPVIVVTGDGSNDIREKCFEYGVKDFITKPYHYDEAKDTIWDVIRRYNK